jgi:protein-tyrosine phosphatase
MYNFLSEEKIIKNNFCTMFADSIMFPYVECDKNAVVKKFQKYVKTQTGFDFNFDFKSLEEEQFIIEDLIDERNQYGDDYIEDDDDIEEEKKEEHGFGINPWNDMDAIYKHPIGKGTIFVGNKIAAENLSLLKQLKVTRVINCTFDNLSVPNFHEKHFKYYNFAIRNWNKYITSANSTILEFIYPVFRFIDPAIEKGENVLVHCYLGAHRAGTLATACLMYYENLDVASAISKAKTLRPIVNPRGKLKEFLYKFEFDKNHKNGTVNYEYDDEYDDDDDDEENEDDNDFN